MDSIDSLNIQISADASKASQTIDRLVNSIDKLSGSFVKSVDNASKFSTSITKNISQLNKIDTSKLLSASEAMNRISEMFGTLSNANFNNLIP